MHDTFVLIEVNQLMHWQSPIAPNGGPSHTLHIRACDLGGDYEVHTWIVDNRTNMTVSDKHETIEYIGDVIGMIADTMGKTYTDHMEP